MIEIIVAPSCVERDYQLNEKPSPVVRNMGGAWLDNYGQRQQADCNYSSSLFQ